MIVTIRVLQSFLLLVILNYSGIVADTIVYKYNL